MREAILRSEGLKAFYVLRSFGKDLVVRAVDGVEVMGLQGEVLGIAGESGCGKSTLLKALFALIEPPLRLMGGKLFYHLSGKDIDVFSLRPKERQKLRWKFISYIPQGSMSVLNPVTRIKRTFKDFLESHADRQTKREALKIARRHLSELGLPLKVLDCYPHQLSGGMRQRVTIALASLLQPKVILADEPTTALDVVVQRGVIQLLRGIQKRWGTTLVLVSHDMGVQANIADRIGIMYAGKIVEEAAAQEIFETPLHPYTKHLISSLPRFGDKGAREGVPGKPPSLCRLPSGCVFHPRCPYKTDLCLERMPQLVAIDNHRRVACWLARSRDGTAS